MSKQKLNKRAGLYHRLSKDDERAGESLSIENQKRICEKIANENGFEIVDDYVDDGWTGTNFNRPDVQRLLEDARNGRINVIIVKDLSSFGRNYIEVGQYTDYIFQTYNIRLIALGDNVDSANTENAGMDMTPNMNVFNEWHAANTRHSHHLWSCTTVKQLLQNPTYLGHLVQMRTTNLSYKNKIVVKRDPDEMVTVENTHEAIVSQELWDKCREMEATVSQGKKTATGFVHPLSGLVYCADCGNKMYMKYNNTRHSRKGPRVYYRENYCCGAYE